MSNYTAIIGKYDEVREAYELPHLRSVLRKWGEADGSRIGFYIDAVERPNVRAWDGDRYGSLPVIYVSMKDDGDDVTVLVQDEGYDETGGLELGACDLNYGDLAYVADFIEESMTDGHQDSQPYDA